LQEGRGWLPVVVLRIWDGLQLEVLNDAPLDDHGDGGLHGGEPHKHLQIALIYLAQFVESLLLLEHLEFIAVLLNVSIVELVAEAALGRPQHVFVELVLEMLQ